MKGISRRAMRICAAAVYPLAAVFDLWVLYLSLHAVGISVSPTAWWIGWSVGYAVLSPAPRIAGTAAGQRLGTVMSCAYTLHGILAWAAAAGLFFLIVLPLFGDHGTGIAGVLALAFFAFALLAGICGILHGRRLYLREYTLITAKVLPRDGLRIVHLSDLHLGFIQNDRFVQSLVRRVNGLRPDLICITGDFFSDTMRPLRDPMKTASILAGLSARYGVFACLGNHDTADAAEMASFFDRAGIRVLSEEALFPAANLAMIGRADATPGGIPAPRAEIGECMIGTDPLQYRIVLDHQPRDIAAVAAAGADLLLSGHTHGGQYYPIRAFVRHRFPDCAGLYVHGALSVIVSPGSGAGSPPIRLGSRGEILLITVRPSAD